MLKHLTTMKLLFWFRKSEAKDQYTGDPVGTIQCRININNNLLQIGSTGVECKKSAWDSENQIVRGSMPSTKRNNKRLSDISSALYRIFDILTVKYECVTPALVKEHYHVKKKFIYSISEIRDAYFLHRENQVAKLVITKSTLEVNENYARHIMDFAKIKNVVNPMDISETFLSDLFDWMIDDDRSGERFARKVAIFCKHMLKWGKKKNLCPSLSIFDVDMPGKADSDDDLDTTHLNIFQLDRLLKFDFNLLVQAGQIMKSTADTLNEERNAFVFNCFTGMHHCDYQDKKFYLEPYGDALFLKGCRRKTKKSFAIKLLSPAERIIELYDNDLQKLPIKTNQKRNQTLKLVAMYVGIPLVLTTKIARKTFTDLALNEMMMTADDVAACLGLSSTKFLKNYGRIREKRLVKVMKSWKRLNKINKMNKAS